MKTLTKIFFINLIFIASIFSQNINTGLTFLKSGNDGRSAAMGEAFTAVTNDLSSFYYNPASLRSSDRRQISMSHRQGFADVTSDHIGASLQGDQFSYGFSAITTSIGGIEVRQRPGDPEGTFDARNAAIGVGISYSLFEKVSLGVSGKLLYEKIYIDEASGYSMDAGALYTFSENITTGLSILNIGKMGSLRSDQTRLPTTIRLGGSYSSPLAPDISFIAASDIVKTIDDNAAHLHVGFEIEYDDMFMLRGGYQSGYETKSVSGGFGVLYGILRLDYAIVPMSGAFSPNHTITLNFYL